MITKFIKLNLCVVAGAVLVSCGETTASLSKESEKKNSYKIRAGSDTVLKVSTQQSAELEKSGKGLSVLCPVKKDDTFVLVQAPEVFKEKHRKISLRTMPIGCKIPKSSVFVNWEDFIPLDDLAERVQAKKDTYVKISQDDSSILKQKESGKKGTRVCGFGRFETLHLKEAPKKVGKHLEISLSVPIKDCSLVNKVYVFAEDVAHLPSVDNKQSDSEGKVVSSEPFNKEDPNSLYRRAKAHLIHQVTAVGCGQTSVTMAINVLNKSNRSVYGGVFSSERDFSLLAKLNALTKVPYQDVNFNAAFWPRIEKAVNEKGIPVIVGLGAPFTSSIGHIVMIIGVDGDNVYYADPGGPSQPGGSLVYQGNGTIKVTKKSTMNSARQHQDGNFLFIPAMSALNN